MLAFLAPVDYAAGSNPQGVVTADFTNDGRQDLAVVNYSDSTVSVLVGSAVVPGTFDAKVTSPTGANPKSIAVGDFNEDGNMDVATADNYEVSVLLGDGTGALAPAPGSPIAFGSNPQSVAVGDLNGDGNLDLGVTSNIYYPGYYYFGYYGYYSSSAHVLLGDGLGGFSTPNSTFLDYAFHDTALAADLNGDAYDDFVTFHSYGYVSVLLGDSSGFLQGPSLIYTGDYSYGLDAGDVDGDLDNDLVTANYYGNSAGVLLGDGLGGFSALVNYAVSGYPTSIVLGDFTRDGSLDVATSNQSSSQVSVLYGGGDGAFSAPTVSASGSFPWDIAAGDFNGDGWLDAATANSGDSVSVLVNDQIWPDPPPPSVSINDPGAVLEGNTGSAEMTFTLTLSHAYDEDVTVQYATADITAAAGSDYTAASGDVIIPAGQTSGTFTISVTGDRLPEPNESFAVNLSSATNATIGDGQGIGAILDNEPRISINDVSKSEGKNRKTTLFTFTVTLSAAYDEAVTMSFTTVDGTATSGSGDYVAKTGTLTFAPGETTKTITIEVKGDNKKEADEAFYLDLFGNSSNSLFSKKRGVGTILNDDRR